AGVGKTRLIEEALAPWQRRSPARVYAGAARGASGPMAPVAAMLRGRFGLVDGMSEETCRMWLRSEVSALLGDSKVEDWLYFLGQVLELPFADSPLTRAVADDALQGRLLRRAVLRQLIEADASAGPVVMWLDDAHAASSEVLELLAHLLEEVKKPLLIVFSGRPELVTTSEALRRALEGRHARVELGALSQAEAQVVIEALLEPCDEAPPALVEAAAALARGNPQLLERMVRLYHDAGVLEVTAQGWRAHPERLATVKLPLTVDEVEQARLEALAPAARRLLERATVLGSVFWLGGLLALVRLDEPPPASWHPGDDQLQELRQQLEELVDRDYLLRLPDSAFSGDVEYVFKSSKLRERLSAGLSVELGRRLHQAAADWLAQKPQLRAHEEHVALLARQLEQAGSREVAARRFIEAGDVARARYANGHAADYYQRGLDLLGDTEAALRLEALHNLGDVLLLLGRIDEAHTQFEQMRALAWRLDLPAKGGAAHNRLGRLFRDTGRLDEAVRYLEAGHLLFERAGDERGVASSVDDMGKVHWLRGDYVSALRDFRRGLTMRKSLGDPRSIALSLNNLGLALHDSGHYPDARDAFEQSLALRRQSGDLLGVVTSLNNIGTLAQDEQQHSQALAYFEQAMTVARQVGDKNRVALVLTNIGETYHRLGRAPEAVAVLEQAEALCDELGDKLGLAEVLRELGEAYLLRGEVARARTCIGRAVELFAVVRSKAHLGAALRTLGEITAAGGWGERHAPKARDYFLQAIKLFEELGNGLEEARSCEALARLLATTSPAAAEPMQRRAAALRQRLQRAEA
ncbi:MAG: tetratricopeptide repeat protein, partial [Myxococcales bacterium]